MVKLVCGYTLIAMISASAVLALAGIWGFISGDTATQLFSTFVVIGGTAVGLSYAMEQFLNIKK